MRKKYARHDRWDRQHLFDMSPLEPLAINSLRDTAKMMCLSHNAVRLLEISALNKIRRALLPFCRESLGTEIKMPTVEELIRRAQASTALAISRRVSLRTKISPAGENGTTQ